MNTATDNIHDDNIDTIISNVQDEARQLDTDYGIEDKITQSIHNDNTELNIVKYRKEREHDHQHKK